MRGSVHASAPAARLWRSYASFLLLTLLALFAPSGHAQAEMTDANAPAESEAAAKQFLSDVTADTLIAQLDENNDTSRIIDMAADDEGTVYFIQESKDRLSADWSFSYKKISSDTGKLQLAPFGWENLNIPMTVVKLKPGSIFYDEGGKRMLVGGYDLSEKRMLIKTWDPAAPVLYSAPSRPMDKREFVSGNLFMMLDDQKALVTDVASGSVLIGDASGLRNIASMEGGSSYHRRIKALRRDGAVYLFDTGSGTLSVVNEAAEELAAVKTVELPFVSAAAVHEGAFYLASGKKLYRLATDGTVAEYFDLANVRYKPGLFASGQKDDSAPQADLGPIESVDLIAFDRHGNLLVYDDAKKMLRRINLYVEPAPPAPEQEDAPPPAEPEDCRLRAQPSLDALAIGMDGREVQRDAIDLVVGEGGEAMVLQAEAVASETKQSGKRYLKYYDGTTGKTEDLAFGETYHLILRDAAVPGGLRDVPLAAMIPQKLAYNPYAKEIWIGARYAGEKLASFFSAKPDVKLKAYQNDLPAFSGNDFMIVAGSGQFIYSSVADKKVYVRPLDGGDEDADQEVRVIPLEFSGGKTAAVEKEGALYVYDAGWRTIYAIELASGAVTGTIAVQQSFDYIAGQNGLLIGISGTKLYRLKETGAAVELADLLAIPANRGLYDPVSQAYRTEKFAPRITHKIKLLSMDAFGNPYILDDGGNLWRVNLFE